MQLASALVLELDHRLLREFDLTDAAKRCMVGRTITHVLSILVFLVLLNIWIRGAQADEPTIDFAYPTQRFYDNRAEGKPGAGGPPGPG